MVRYIIRRILQSVPLLFIISIVLFTLLNNMGDPVATLSGRKVTRPQDRVRLRCQLGFDDPIYMRYVYWLVGNDWEAPKDCDGDGVAERAGRLQGVLRGDFGTSLSSRGKAVTTVISERLPDTLLLMVTAEVVIIVVSLLIGLYSALRQYSLLDHAVTATTFVFYSMPIFLIALMSMYLFGVLFKRWGWLYLPTTGMFDPEVGATPLQTALHMVLPVFSLSATSIAAYSRYIRSTMLEVMSQDYIRTAKSKGLPRRDIILIHALKNASLPIVTVIGLDIPLLLGGAVVTEGIFGWGGMGKLFLDGVKANDTPVVMVILMLIAVAVVIFQIITDLIYAWLDPRIRFD